MPLEMDPIYYTETMVKIFREQGSIQWALELAEKILEKNPDHVRMRQWRDEMKQELKQAFERFKNSARQGTPSEKRAEETPPSVSAASLTEECRAAAADTEAAPRQKKILRLRALLDRVRRLGGQA